jgi:hypothetical protein
MLRVFLYNPSLALLQLQCDHVVGFTAIVVVAYNSQLDILCGHAASMSIFPTLTGYELMREFFTIPLHNICEWACPQYRIYRAKMSFVS